MLVDGYLVIFFVNIGVDRLSGTYLYHNRQSWHNSIETISKQLQLIQDHSESCHCQQILHEIFGRRKHWDNKHITFWGDLDSY